MTIASLDYPKVFNRLCHMVALTKDGKTRAAVDDIVLTLFALDDTLRLTNATDVAGAIEGYYGLILRDAQLREALDRNMRAGHLLRQPGSGAYYLPPDTKAAIGTRVRDAATLEERVREEWLASLDAGARELPAAHQGHLWACLQVYLAKVFYRHGVETIQLLAPAVPISAEAEKGLAAYLNEAVREKCDDTCSAVARDAIQAFFQTSTPLRTQYLAQLLDGTFTFFALSVDEATSAYLKGSLTSLRLFLDTNFIFGILNISTNPLVDVSQELIEFIKIHKLPFKLYYREETLEEMYRTIHPIAERLKARRWQSRTSWAAVASGRFEGLELRYHEKNAEAPIDPAIFLSPYEHLPELLKGYGFHIWRDSAKAQEPVERKALIIADYKAYMEAHRPGRPKPYEALNHDIAVWLAVQRLRNRGSSALDVGALFLTNDTYFRRFDWEQLRERDTVGSVVLPNHFLQLLRPFVPASADFDRRFVETFALPEFRATGAGYAATPHKVLSYIDAYSNIPEQTAVHMLRDEMLAGQLRDVAEDSAEVEAVMEHALLQGQAGLIEEKEAAEAERQAVLARARDAERSANESVALAAQRDQQVRHLQEQLRLHEAAAQERERQAREAERRAQQEQVASRAREEAGERQLKQLQEQVDGWQQRWACTKRRARSSALYLLVFLVGIFVTLVATRLFGWSWWSHHPRRVNLLGCVALIWGALAWVSVIRQHREKALLIVGLGALLVILQIA